MDQDRGGTKLVSESKKKSLLLNFAGKIVYKKLTPNDPYNSVCDSLKFNRMVVNVVNFVVVSGITYV